MNTEISLLIHWLLTSNVEISEFLQWYQYGTPLVTSCPCNNLEILKPELVLSLCNFIREQTTQILGNSQNISKTPSKGNYPCKYNYHSPVKNSTTNTPTTNKSRRSCNLEERFSKAAQISPIHREGRRSLDSSLKKSRRTPELGDFLIVKSHKKSSQKDRHRKKKDGDEEQEETKTVKKKVPLISEKVSNFNNPIFYSQNDNDTFNTRDDDDNNDDNDHETKKILNIDKSSQKVIPQLENVTFKKEIDKLIELYVFCLDSNLVPNICVEVYLCLELLGAMETQTNKYSFHIFESLHNVVYFSSTVLSRQFETFLRFVNRTTLKALLEFERIGTFSPELKAQLMVLMETEKKITHEEPNLSFLENLNVSSVRFQKETDARSNFPNDSSFQNFKIQRDCFYELLRHWESRDETETVFWNTFEKKVESLLHYNSHPINLFHFTRLFQAQLLSSCVSDNFVSPDELMEKLQNYDKAKIRKLQCRLVTPAMFGGPCPKPQFNGPQEFYRDFIHFTSSSIYQYGFIAHLKNSLSETLLEYNHLFFDVSLEIYSLQSEFATNLNSARILGKFLGYIESLPHQCSGESITKEILDSQMRTRIYYSPPIPLLDNLSESVKKKRLIMTLPWIVEYCSMLDPLSPHFPYYINLYKMLLCLYRHLKKLNLNDKNQFFLRVYLGWLFENPLFPREYLTDQRTPLSDYFEKLDFESSSSFVTLDSLPLLTSNLLYICCPYLSEFKVLLSQFSNYENQGSKVHSASNTRKIIPISTQNIREKSGLQLEMEKNFFHNQSVSVKKTVDFISERLASNTVKYIRSTIIQNEEKLKISELICFSLQKNDAVDVMKKIPDWAEESYSRIRAKSKEYEFSLEAIRGSLTHLLGEETSKVVLDTCIVLCTRQIKEKISQWIDEFVTIRYFIRDYETEVKKQSRNNKSSSKMKDSSFSLVRNFEVKKITKSCPPSELLIALKEAMKNMLFYNQIYTETDVMSLLENLEKSIQSGRPDLTDMALKGLQSLNLDWILTLISTSPDSITPTVLDKLLHLWTTTLPLQNSPPLITSRNMMLLQQSTSAKKSWKKFEELILRIIKAKLMLVSHLEDSCVELLRYEWPQFLLKNLSSCLQGVVDVLERNAEDVSSLVEWIAWFVTFLNDYDDFPEL